MQSLTIDIVVNTINVIVTMVSILYVIYRNHY